CSATRCRGSWLPKRCRTRHSSRERCERSSSYTRNWSRVFCKGVIEWHNIGHRRAVINPDGLIYIKCYLAIRSKQARVVEKASGEIKSNSHARGRVAKVVTIVAAARHPAFLAIHHD